MQSAVPHVLATLERTHDPANVARAVAAARAAGLQVSVDLIYGTPGESLRGLARPASTPPSPSSPTTSRPTPWSSRRAPSSPRQVRRGRGARARGRRRGRQVRARRRACSPAAGYGWYEVSNWARSDEAPLPPQRGLLGRRQLVGRRARARTATSAACGGGTSSTPARMPPGSAAGRVAGRRAARRSTDEQRYDERVLLGDPAASTGCPSTSCERRAGPRWPA